jgi:hypothetical protein
MEHRRVRIMNDSTGQQKVEHLHPSGSKRLIMHHALLISPAPALCQFLGLAASLLRWLQS